MSQFILQHHLASTDHFDLRLEIDGVYRSFAVPKGLGTKPGDVRLAVRTDDHPLDYMLEGTIAPGNYGAGTVQLFDVGEYSLKDPIEDKKINFYLDGHRYGGYFTLVKTNSDWLVLTHEIETRFEPDVSILTGRNIQEIYEHAPLKPQLARLVDKLPEGLSWVYELKHDGVRIVAERQPLQDFLVAYPSVVPSDPVYQTRLSSRNGHDRTGRYPHIVAEIERLGIEGYLDGEAVVLQDGVSDFGLLNKQHDHRAVYMVWDKPDHPGCLEERKACLKSLVKDSKILVYVDHVDEIFDPCSMPGVEGAVAKNKNCFYQPGQRSDCWQKIKCKSRQEFILLGFTPGEGNRSDSFGAIEVGYYENGRLKSAGNVGTGFTREDLDILLDAHGKSGRGFSRSSYPSFVLNLARSLLLPREADLSEHPVVEVEFLGWTKNGKLRHPSYKGLREDKDPREVVREYPASLSVDRIHSNLEGLPSQILVSCEMLFSKIRGIRIEEHTFSQITHPDKILFSDENLTKADLARYYERVANDLVPEIQDRPLTLLRCPNGVDKECFIQRNAPNANDPPPGLKVVTNDGNSHYIVSDRAGLRSLAQLNVCEIHPWNNRVGHGSDRMVFDLDPDSSLPWERTVEAARHMRDVLQSRGYKPSVRTTGGKGLHIVVDIPERDAALVREEAKEIAQELKDKYPELYTTSPSLKSRKGKVYLDWLRNDQGSTSIASWSPRAVSNAAIAKPVSWNELDKILPDMFTIKDFNSKQPLSVLTGLLAGIFS